ncbi:MAG TPA: dUTP diphosphatase [Thermoanaerobaculia bacterium]|jgi:dUTP pyrophosphatase|nr:dUTP diphosphatase [Thermoanaerobaculia bacterium]
MAELVVSVTVLPHGEGLDLPSYATPGSAGCDLRAAVEQPLTLAPGARALVPTGIAVAIPPGHEGQVRMRSGLALRQGLSLLNGPGTIDSDYRGEIGVILANLGAETVTIARGDRIAQLVIAPVAQARLQKVDALPATSRDAGGFGSTGKR